ncbi:MAG: NAD(P)H-dependent oxidoreductase subunit E [Calditrichaeota bacterium]|nr:NAD(P)H-dependent oxidoreductase subunit E [Calditrichota bacterium]MCB9367331.1 NAD(P)H-dependent oxidoreductase subunit E [Calditrichota bacterium]
MQRLSNLPDPPNSDEKWKGVQLVMRKHGQSPHALIETLHAVQHAFGYLDRDSLTYVSDALGVPLSKVYGVATFYQYFTLKKPGTHNCVVCTGTACYIKGVPKLVEALKERYGMALDEVSADGSLTLQSACCIGTCGLAPIASVDGEELGRLSAEELLDKLEEVIHGDA